jgi:hypothetical protein
MPKCTVCHHPQHLEINQAILSKDLTLAALSQKYGLHPSSLQRHKNHIEVKMTRAHRRLREIREQGSLLVLNDLLEKVRRHIAAADAQGNYLAVFRGSHVASRLIHQMGRVEGDMQPDTLHRLISSPAWVPAGLLPTDPSLITGLHQGLVDGAFAPCPEPPPEVSAQAAGEADDLDLAEPLLESGNSELETGLATLRRFLPDLDLTLDDLPPLTGKLPKNERKISEKAAAKTTRCALKRQLNQEYRPSEKNFPRNRESAPKTANCDIGRESAAPPVFPETTAPPAVSATDAPAASSGFSYDPYLPAPANGFYLPSADFPAADASQEILPEPQARFLTEDRQRKTANAISNRKPRAALNADRHQLVLTADRFLEGPAFSP